ncbi:hypothetical protein [Methylobacterium soli]|uniref:DUF4214 domain-containing protein n=1 Tax=Methylobacterium soli TaxID=553447 RepID=A0A6L3SU49_9HYPH|nr:hypothetical protein [Methylobacterium soli]KAB1077150.1 hypothetical protein F6X53_19895 [Methylobacterium soli]GJE43909.1 hypothetical protein AEGHOMDF_3089 [Methylobacterium soli]
MNYFTQQIASGAPKSILEAQLLGAPEVQTYGAPELSNLVNKFTSTYGLSPTEVNTLRPAADQFASFLGRGVDTPTLQAWDQQIDAGQSLPTILAQMFQAPEVQALQGTGGFQTAATAFGSQFGVNPADFLRDAMLVGPSGVTGTGNTNPANSIGGAANPATAFRGFEPSAYLLANPDVANSSWAGNPLGHYETYGYNEGRSLGNGLGPLGAGFDPTSYFNANPDVKAAGVDPLAHYLTNGAAEGRQATFSPDVGPYAFGKYSSTSLPGPGAKSPVNDGQPLGSGITYNGGSVQYGGVDIGGGALFDPYSSEQAYLNSQVDSINQGAQAAANTSLMLTGTNPFTGYVPMPTFAVNGTNQSNGGAVAASQGQYLNNVNTALAAMAPVAPAGSSFLPRATTFGW